MRAASLVAGGKIGWRGMSMIAILGIIMLVFESWARLTYLNVWFKNLLLDGMFLAFTVKSLPTVSERDKMSDYWKVERLRVRPYKYWCCNIKVWFRLLTRGLFKAPRRWAGRRRHVGFRTAVTFIEENKLETSAHRSSAFQGVLKECRTGWNQTVCIVLPFMPSPEWFISSDVGAAG